MACPHEALLRFAQLSRWKLRRSFLRKGYTRANHWQASIAKARLLHEPDQTNCKAPNVVFKIYAPSARQKIKGNANKIPRWIPVSIRSGLRRFEDNRISVASFSVWT